MTSKTIFLVSFCRKNSFVSISFAKFVTSYAEMCTLVRMGGVGQDIMKGVYYALVLTVRNRRKISNCKSEQSSVDAP